MDDHDSAFGQRKARSAIQSYIYNLAGVKMGWMKPVPAIWNQQKRANRAVLDGRCWKLQHVLQHLHVVVE